MFMLGRSDHKKKIPVWLGILLVFLGLILLSFVWMYLIVGPELFSSMRGFDTTQEDAFREDSILDVSDVVFQMIDQNQLSPDETIKIDENDMKKWFNDKISIYMNGVFLDTERKMIIFEDITADIPLENKI